jgi:capsular exopolysaccharide synthesis family protein
MLIKPTNMLKLKDARPGQTIRPEPADASAEVRTPLYQILWERRITVAAAFGGVLTAATLYLLIATPIFTATAHIYIEQNTPKVATDMQGVTLKDENFLPTQVEIIRSAPILQAALTEVHWSRLKSFKNVEGDPLDWLWRNSGFKVEVGKKDDILTISFDSAFPQEGADFVNAIVKGFVNYQSTLKRGTGTDMVRILEAQKTEVENELDNRTRAMLKFKADNGALSFKDQDRGNIILERLASLSTSLTAAEMARLDLETQYNQAKAVLASPTAITHFVQSQQMKEKDWGDHSYDELRSQLVQAQLKLASFAGTLDSSNPRVQALRQYTNELDAKVKEKERAIAEANAADIAQQLSAMKEKEQSIRTTLDEQQKRAMDLNVKAAEYDRLAADVERVQKQSDLLDTRIKEVRLNSQDAGSLSVNVLAPARVATLPSKPKKSFVLAAAGLLGLILGSGLALLRDYRDRRIRSVEEGATLLGIPILGMIPQMRTDLTVAGRGQIVHRDPMCEAAEAYRTIRTALHFGATSAVKCVLVTSPTPGDGKSVTASNLAIAMAQAGHRTLLIDADLRRPTQQLSFEVNATAGLSTVLAGICSLQEALYETPVEGLSLLPSGPVPINPSELLSSTGFAAFVQMVSDNYDRVVIDSPPVLPVADTKAIAALADAVLLVVRIDKSDRKASALALEGLQSVRANVFGWVANDMSIMKQVGYAGYYGNYYGQGGQGKLGTRAVQPESRPPAADLSDLLKPSPQIPTNKVA